MALTLVITDAGRAALVNARNDGTNAVRIASAGVSATAILASPAATTLPGETKRIATISGDRVARDVIHLVVQDETMDSYTLRSFGLYLDNGVLFALYGQPTPIIEKSAQALLLLAIDVTLQDVAAGQITFGDANFLQPPATIDRAGVIALATEAEATAGIDRNRAITPYTLRVTYGDVWRASNDGAGSGLDADLLDGRQGAEFALLTGAEFTGPVIAAKQVTGRANIAAYPPTNPTSIGAAEQLIVGETTHNPAYRLSVGYWLDTTVGQYRGVINAIAASNLAPLDIQPSGGLALFGGPVTAGKQITGNANIAAYPPTNPTSIGTAEQLIIGEATHNPAYRLTVGYWLDAGSKWRGVINAIDASIPAPIDIQPSGGASMFGGGVNVAGSLTRSGSRVWDAANDGAGSGLDADLLDGQHGSWYADIVARLGFTPLRSSDTADVWRIGNDGAGSGLDADLLDGRQGAEFALLSGSAFTGPVSADKQITGKANLAVYPAVNPTSPGTAEQLIVGEASHHPAYRLSVGYWLDGIGQWRGLINAISASNPAPIDIQPSGGMTIFGGPVSIGGEIVRGGSRVWDAGNDGAGSGLDADLLDGRDSGSFATASHGHGAADIAGAFLGLLSENGYTVFPNGLILQWVTGALMGAGQETTQLVSFPVAFPNACFGAVASTRDEYFSRAADVMFSTMGAPANDAVTVGRKQFSGSADDQVASRPFIVAIGR